MEYYLWIKAFHVMSVLSWMAMLFYLPRLFVYHVENKDNEGFVRVAKIQEHKLYYYIGHPAMIAAAASGLAMLYINPTIFHSGGWLHVKLTLAVLMIAYHYDCRRHLRLLAEDKSEKSGKFFRAYNEIPTLLMIGIVIFVIVKPF